MEFEINPHKDTVILGEPLIVAITVRNPTQEVLQLYYFGTRTYAKERIGVVLPLLSSDSSAFAPWEDGFAGVTRRMQPLILQPGKHVTDEFVILYRHEEGFVFDTLGQYWLSAKVIVIAPEGEQPPYFYVEADPVAITVQEPGVNDQALCNWLKLHGEDYGALVQVPWEAESRDELVDKDDDSVESGRLRARPLVSRGFIDECRMLCEQSNSMYTQYLALFLSRWYGEGPGKDRAEAARFAELASANASSETARNLAARASKAIATTPQAEAAQPPAPAQPVAGDLRREVEGVFQGYIAAADAADLEHCLELQAEDFRGWSRAFQREQLQEDIDELQDLRGQGIPAGLSARVLAVVQSGKDVVVTAMLSYRQGTSPVERQTVRCLVRKYGDQWLLQDWDHESMEK